MHQTLSIPYQNSWLHPSRRANVSVCFLNDAVGDPFTLIAMPLNTCAYVRL